MKGPFSRLYLWSRMLRLLPPGMTGKTRLARAMLGHYLQTRDVCVHARHDCTFLVPSLSEPIAFHLLVDGVYEPMVAKFLLSRLRPGATFVDIGASIGVFAIPAARQVGPIGCVLAVEASPRVFFYLEHNVKINGLSNIRLKQCALYDRNAQSIPFYEPPASHFGMGALVPQFGVQPTSVPARPLDYILSEEGIGHVDLVKVDVEGFEAAVFRGAKQLLTGHNPPLIVFEFCDWAEGRISNAQVGGAQRVLRDYGYQIWRISDFMCGKPPVRDVLIRGFEMLVASKKDIPA